MKIEGDEPRIFVREARASDREAVLKFCEKTWSWGDYIPEVWDRWLKEEKGRVFVATINGVPVGISHLSCLRSDEVWLSGARTDPNYRRRGVMTAITKKCLEYAKTKNAKVARLVTDFDNVAARAVLKKLKFRPVAEFIETSSEKITVEKTESSRWACIDETETLWNYLQRSEVYRKSAGLYTVLFHWFSLRREDLKRFVHQQKVIVHENSRGIVDGLMLIDDATAREWRESTLQTCYIDGDYKAVLDMTRFLKNHCHSLGIKKIYGFACKHTPIVKALEKLGFEPADIEVVYEKRL